jgi:hypothetical protein
MTFTNDTRRLDLGDWYLLETPHYSESGFVIAQLRRFNGLQPVFEAEVTGEVDDEHILGWCPLTSD